MTQRTDPPAQVSETVGAVFECQRTNNILNDGRSPAKRIKECRPGSQLLRHVGGNQTPADFNLFAQMFDGDNFGALANGAQPRCCLANQFDGVGQAQDGAFGKDRLVL